MDVPSHITKCGFSGFQTPSSNVTQNHTISYMLNIQYTSSGHLPCFVIYEQSPNHHKQSKIINCNVNPLHLVNFVTFLQFKLCLNQIIRNIHTGFYLLYETDNDWNTTPYFKFQKPEFQFFYRRSWGKSEEEKIKFLWISNRYRDAN